MASNGYPGPDTTDQQLVNRLKRLEGQVRGLERMVAGGRECEDILPQIAAVHAALDQVALGLVSRHARECLAGDEDPDSRVERLMVAVAHLPRRV